MIAAATPAGNTLSPAREGPRKRQGGGGNTRFQCVADEEREYADLEHVGPPDELGKPQDTEKVDCC